MRGRHEQPGTGGDAASATVPEDAARPPDSSRPAAWLHSLRLWGFMIKFSHSVFALPFALIAAFLAGSRRPSGFPGAHQLALIVIGMVAARSAAMTFNRIVDAAIDARNPRTQGRPIPAGAISRRHAVGFFVACCAVFVAACAGFLLLDANVWPLALSVPVLAYLCAYSYTKRFTRWSHLVLGSAIALSPPAAWLAVDPGSIGWPACVLMAAVTFWIAGFDVIYACQDVEYDRRDGLFSLPARVGIAAALWYARFAVGLVDAADVAGLGVCRGRCGRGVAAAVGEPAGPRGRPLTRGRRLFHDQRGREYSAGGLRDCRYRDTPRVRKPCGRGEIIS